MRLPRPRLDEAALLVVFGGAIWLRASSLETLPELNGDEAYEGLQVMRWIQGQPFDWLTVNGNPLDPFLILPLVPLHALFGPSAWVLRLPALLCGVLTIVLSVRLLRSTLGHASALITAILVATLPLAIAYSRIGHEYGQIPLAGLLCLQAALRGRPVWLALALGGALLVHPINVFLIPMVAPVVLVGWWARPPAQARPRWAWILGLSLTALAGIALGLILWRRPVVQGAIQARPALDWWAFSDGLLRALLFQFQPPATGDGWLARTVLATLLGLSVTIGLWVVVRQRRRSALALGVGVGLALAMFHLLAGPHQFGRIDTHRYAVVFLMPLCVLLGAWLGPLVPDLSAGTDRQLATNLAGLTVGALFLFAGYSTIFTTTTRDGRERLITPWADAREPNRQVIRRVLADVRADPVRRDRPVQLIGQEYWDSLPLQYLAAAQPGIEVSQLIDLEDIWRHQQGDESGFDRRRLQVRQALAGGAYVVTRSGRPAAIGGQLVAEVIRDTWPAGGLRVWSIPRLRRSENDGSLEPDEIRVYSLAPLDRDAP